MLVVDEVTNHDHIIILTAGVEHLQTKTQSQATLDHFTQIVSYIVSKLPSISFLNLPMHVS